MPNLTIELYKYFSVWVTFSVPTIYTNALSYYETLGKLIVELNKLRDNQNITSENIDLIDSGFLELVKEQQNYLTEQGKDLQDIWNKFYQDTIGGGFQAIFENQFNSFINELETLKQNYINSLDAPYNKYVNDFTTISNTAKNSWQPIWNKLNQDIANLIDELSDKYNTLKTSIDKWYNDFKSVIDDQIDVWNQTYEEYSNRIDNIPETLWNNTDVGSIILQYAKSNPERFKGEPLLKNITFNQVNPTNPSEGDIWLTTESIKQYSGKEVFSYPILKKYTNGEWINIEDNNLYITNDKRVYYCGNIVGDMITKTIQAEPDTIVNGAYVPVAVIYHFATDERDEHYTALCIQKQNTYTHKQIELDYEESVGTDCYADRKFGYSNLKAKDNQNYVDFLYSVSYYNYTPPYVSNYYYQIGNIIKRSGTGGIYDDTNLTIPTLPNPYTNDCNLVADATFKTLTDNQILVPSTSYWSGAYIYQSEDSGSNPKGYYSFNVSTPIYISDSKPICNVNNFIICKNNGKWGYYANFSNGKYTELTGNQNDWNTLLTNLKLDETHKYAFNSTYVYLWLDIRTALQDNDISKAKPICSVPVFSMNESIVHGQSIQKGKYYVGEYGGYCINIENPLADQFQPLNIDIPTSIPYRVDGGSYWGYKYDDETALTTFYIQRVFVGAKEIKYVPIST